MKNEEKDLPKKLDLTGKRLLTVSEAALYLGISSGTLYNCTGPKSKTPLTGLRVKHVGHSKKLVRFDVNDLSKYVDTL